MEPCPSCGALPCDQASPTTNKAASPREELDACPFCGPKSDLVFSQPCSDGGFGVSCRHCHTTMDVRSIDRGAVAAAWNSRHPVKAASPEREAWSDVLAERHRQIEAERRTPAQDDDHIAGEMARGAVAYALSGSGFKPDAAREMWPWSHSGFRPKNPRRDLVRAGALILAEIERLDRASGKA